MVDPTTPTRSQRAHEAERVLFEGVVALEGSISGEHGIGFSKAPFIAIELSPDEIALMKRVKAAFDPHNLLNPGKMFPMTHRFWSWSATVAASWSAPWRPRTPQAGARA